MTTTTTKSAEAPEMPIADRLEHCAKFTGLDAVRELLIEAAAAVRKRDAVVKLLEGELQDLALRPVQVPMTREQMIAAVRPLCCTEALAEKLVDLSMDEYRAVEAHHGITAKAEGGA